MFVYHFFRNLLVQKNISFYVGNNFGGDCKGTRKIQHWKKPLATFWPFALVRSLSLQMCVCVNVSERERDTETEERAKTRQKICVASVNEKQKKWNCNVFNNATTTTAKATTRLKIQQQDAFQPVKNQCSK